MSIASLRNKHTLTRRIIEAIPLDKGDYRPDPVSKSAMEFAWLIVATERGFLEAIATGEFKPSPSPTPESIQNSAELSKFYAEMFAEKCLPVERLSDEQAAKIIDFRGMFQLPAVLYLQFLQSHSIHHRGQLSMYLRPMGAQVPAIYGESYDTAAAKKASTL